MNLENRISAFVKLGSFLSQFSVDTIDDLEKVRTYMKNDDLIKKYFQKV